MRMIVSQLAGIYLYSRGRCYIHEAASDLIQMFLPNLKTFILLSLLIVAYIIRSNMCTSILYKTLSMEKHEWKLV